MSTFGSRLRGLLEENKIDGKDFAEAMKVKPPTVSNWLNGNRFPKNDTLLIAIADYFNVSLDYLLGRTSERNKMTPYTLAAHRENGYDKPLTEDEKRMVESIIDTYRKAKK